MRIEILSPKDLTASVVRDALALVGVNTALDTVSTWTRNELALAYDWAMREHLHASDNRVRQRPQPAFVRLSGAGSMLAAGEAEQAWHKHLSRAHQRRIGGDEAGTIKAAEEAIAELRDRLTGKVAIAIAPGRPGGLSTLLLSVLCRNSAYGITPPVLWEHVQAEDVKYSRERLHKELHALEGQGLAWFDRGRWKPTTEALRQAADGK